MVWVLCFRMESQHPPRAGLLLRGGLRRGDNVGPGSIDVSQKTVPQTPHIAGRCGVDWALA